MVVISHSPRSPYINNNHSKKISLRYGGERDPRFWQTTPKGTNSLDPEGIPKTIPSKTQSRRRRLPSSVISILEALFCLAVFYAIYSLRADLSAKDAEMDQIRRDFSRAQDSVNNNKLILDKTHSSIDELESLFMDLLPGGRSAMLANGEKFELDVVFEKIVGRRDETQHRIDNLQGILGDLNRGEAEMHFGPPPYKLEFQIKINKKHHSFLVEMAPLELVPHSVNFFMQMVKTEIWDNTLFTNNEHVIVAQLQDGLGHDKEAAFAELGVSTLQFPEYSDQYPHDKYTLGFGGRPGGPGFYINTVDNSAYHGPGGQGHYDLLEDADSCFAKVIEGQHVIDMLVADAEHSMIKSIRLIPN